MSSTPLLALAVASTVAGLARCGQLELPLTSALNAGGAADMAKADFERAKQKYPSTEMVEGEWVVFLNARPDVMWAILGDIYNVVRDEQERDAGIHRIGRRPVRAAGSIDEMYRAVFPQQYCNDPFPVALKKLLSGRSQRQFAKKVPCSQSVVSRLLSGDVEPDITLLEAVAVAAKVPPYYFAEYRAMFIGQLVERVLLGQPHLSITAYKRINQDGPS